MNKNYSKLKPIVSKIVLLALIFNLVSPGFLGITNATNYSFDPETKTEAIKAKTQKYDILIPRDIVSGDTLSLFLSGSTDYNSGSSSNTYTQRYGSGASKEFSTSSGVLADFCDTISAGDLANCSFDGENRKYNIEAKIAGKALDIGQLIITRDPLTVSTIPHIVAKAKKVAYKINNTFVDGDTIQINTSSGNVVYTYTYTGSLDFTGNINALIESINSNTTTTGSYNSASGTIELESKVAGQDFSVSSFVTDSQVIYASGTQTNIVAVAQKEAINLRPIVSDETISLYFSGANSSGTITQAFSGTSLETLEELRNKINNLEDVSASLSGTVIEVVSANPGLAFAITNIQITGGKVNTYTTKKNVVAVAQESYIKIPRTIYAGDTINYSITSSGLTYPILYSYTDENYLTGLVNTINNTANLQNKVLAEISNAGLKTIKLTSKIPGTAFTGGELYITSNLLSTQTQTGVIAQKQESRLSLDRGFSAGDKITMIIDGNTITQDFDTNHTQTLSGLVAKINFQVSSLNATITGNTINFVAKNAGTGYNINSLKVVNSIYPTVLHIAENPTLQTNTFSIDSSITGTRSLSISGTTITGSTNQELNDNINALSLTLFVSSELSLNTFTLKSTDPSKDFILSDITTTGSIFTGNTTQTGTLEIKARLELSIDDLSNLAGNSLSIGNCLINFSTGFSTDLDCTDGATIKVEGKDESEIAGLIRALNLSDTNNGVLSKNGTGTGVIFETAGTQTSSTGIYFSGTVSGINLISNIAPQIGTKQISSITFPRDFVPGDNLSLSISGQTINQTYYISSGSSLVNLVMQLNNLPYVNASLSGTTEIVLESANIGESFTLGNAQFVNTQESIQTISNNIGKSQLTQILLPYTLTENDSILMAIDGVEKTFSGNDLISSINSNYSGFTITSTGANGSFVLSKGVGQNYTVNKFEITRNASLNTFTGNIVAVRDIEELRIPLSFNGDLKLDLSGNIINQTYTSDLSGTLDSLNSKINNSGYISTYTTDGTYAIFTITGKADGTDFVANLTATGETVYTSGSIDNVMSGAQVASLDLNGKYFNSNDILTFSLTGSNLAFSPVSISGNSDLSAVYTNLNSAINTSGTNQAIDSTLSGGVLEFTSKVPGTSFGTGVLEISQTLATSSGLVQNVVAQKQIDEIILSRNIVVGDTLTLTYSGTTISQTYSGTQNETLNLFVEKINNSFSGKFITTYSDKIIFTATTAGIGFDTISLKLVNTSVEDLLQENIVAQPQITTISIPELVTGDLLKFTIGGNIISSNSINGLVSDINNSGSLVVNATYNSASGMIVLTGKTAGVPFDFDSSLINYSNPLSSQEFVVPVNQISELNPQGTPREALTYFVEINGQNFEYTTGTGDTTATVINNLSTQINTGSVASTGARAQVSEGKLVLTSYSSGVSFNVKSGIADRTAPLILEGQNNSIETLKSGSTSSGKVSINEKGTMYFVLSGSYLGTGTLNNLINSGSGFKIDLEANTSTGVQIPAGLADGKYNLVASDLGQIDTFSGTTFIPNYSSETNGFILIDNTAPIVSINTLSGITVNTNTINITGNSEANTKILSLTVTGSGEFTKTTYSNTTDGAGNFSLTGALYQNTSNIISLELQDEAGNIGTASLIVNQDNINPEFTNLVYPNLTKNSTGTISIETENNILASVYSGSNLLYSGTTSNTGNIDFVLELTPNIVNEFSLKLTDKAGNTSSTGVSIRQDNLSPVIIGLNPLNNTRVHQENINISGITEPNSQVTITNSGLVYTGTTTSTGSFDINIALNHSNGVKTDNNIIIETIDEAGNIYNTGIVIIEDSIPNSLVIGQVPIITKELSLTFTGTYKAGTTLTFTGTYKAGTTLTFTGGTSFEDIQKGTKNFTATVNLKQNQENIIEVSANDSVLGLTGVTLNIVQDNIRPSLNITTQSGLTTNNSYFTISGNSEDGTIITITGGSGTITLNTGTGTEFIASVELNKNNSLTTINNLVIEAKDLAGNTTIKTLTVIQDPIVNFMNLSVSGTLYTNQDTFTFTGTTKPGLNLIITGGSGIVLLNSSNDGTFSGNILLNINTQNNIIVSSTDAVGTTSTGSFIIINDQILPGLQITSEIPEYTNNDNLYLTGITQNSSIVEIGLLQSVSNSGIFNFTYPLEKNILNQLYIKSTDQAGNISTGVVSITHDNTKASFSGISLSQLSLSGNIQNISYSFNTSEYTNSTIYFGTGTNIIDTLVASKYSSGTSFSGTIYGFDSTKNYYYLIESIDKAGNTTYTVVSQIDSIPVVVVPTPETPTNQVEFDFLPLLGSGTETTLSGEINVGSGFELIGESFSGNIYIMSGFLLNNSLSGITLTGVNIDIPNDTKIYTQSSSINFEKKEISVSLISSGNTNIEFIKSIRLGGEETILLNTPVLISLNDSVSNKFAYKKSSSTNWIYGDIENSECNVNFTTQQVCSYRKDTNTVIIKTLHFTDFSVVKTSVIHTPAPFVVSSGGGGGGGGISRDYCPNGDYSSSYYDGKCGIKPDNSENTSTGNIDNNIKNELNNVSKDTIYSQKDTLSSKLRFHYLLKAKEKKLQYKGYTILDISGFEDSKITIKLSQNIINSTKISDFDKKRYITTIDRFLRAKYSMEISKGSIRSIKIEYYKSQILFNNLLKKLGYK